MLWLKTNAFKYIMLLAAFVNNNFSLFEMKVVPRNCMTATANLLQAHARGQQWQLGPGTGYTLSISQLRALARRHP